MIPYYIGGFEHKIKLFLILSNFSNNVSLLCHIIQMFQQNMSIINHINIFD